MTDDVEVVEAEEQQLTADTTVDEEELEQPPLTTLVLLRDQIQKLRIAQGNRKSAAERNDDETRMQLHDRYYVGLKTLEDSINKDIADEIETHPAWPWLQQIRGVAASSAASVVGLLDIHKAPTPSSFIKFCGYGLTHSDCEKCAGSGYIDGMGPCVDCGGDGTIAMRDRLQKGHKAPFNKKAKSMVWRLVDLQVKLRGPYRVTYDDAKHSYKTTRPDWTPGHIEAAARRKAAKLFLSHLWHVWAEAEGLETVEPFVIARDAKRKHDLIDPYKHIGAKRPE